MATPRSPARLDVYGLDIRLEGWPELVDSLRLDFAWFEAGDDGRTAHVDVVVERGAPDPDAYGEVPAAAVTPRSVVFRDGDRVIADHLGAALSVREGDRFVVRGEDADVVHEAGYLFLRARIGEHLESLGFLRLHAVGVAGPAGALALVLPSGGGKSTVALRALADEGVRLLSDDSPLLDADGRLHPFPLRIGVNEHDAGRVLPPGPRRRIELMGFRPKYALEVDAFRHRVEPNPRPLRHLVVGRRSLGRAASLEPLDARGAAATLFRENVVGAGVYQGMTFAAQRGAGDVARKLTRAGGRTARLARAARRARLWRLTLGRDHDRNWEVLRPLLG